MDRCQFFLEPTLSLEDPLPLTTSVQAHHWSVDCHFSVGDKNRLSFLMDQSTGQVLESHAARNCQGEPGQGQACGYRVKPTAGCVPCALFLAPTTRGMTCKKPGNDQSRPEVLKAHPTAEFSMSLLQGDPQPLQSICSCSFASKTFNFSNNICSLCFPQFNENFSSFEKFETGTLQKTSFPSDGSTFYPSFSNQKNPPYGRN